MAERSEERFWCAELHRLRGVFLAAKGAEETQIEASFCAAIRIAKEQKSVSLEKRTGNLCGISEPKSERVRRTRSPTTSLVTDCGGSGGVRSASPDPCHRRWPALYRYGGQPLAKPFRATSPGSDCCFEDRRNGLSKRSSTASAGIGSNISLVCSPTRVGNETQPIPENHAVGPFLEVRAGRFTARRAKETLVYKIRGEATVEIIKAGSEDEGVDP